MNSFWLHPSLILILGALVLPLVPARLKKGYLLLIPILLFARILTMAHGEFGQVHVLNKWPMVFGRVDALSSVFGYIMSLMCILGTLYGLHVKEDAQHIASWFYVAGSVGCIYAGDFITLFLFWELMAFPPCSSSGSGAGGNRCSRDTATCLCTSLGVWRCLAAWSGIAKHRAVGLLTIPSVNWRCTTRPQRPVSS
jgi:hypothetical protein